MQTTVSATLGQKLPIEVVFRNLVRILNSRKLIEDNLIHDHVCQNGISMTRTLFPTNSKKIGAILPASGLQLKESQKIVAIRAPRRIDVYQQHPHAPYRTVLICSLLVGATVPESTKLMTVIRICHSPP